MPWYRAYVCLGTPTRWRQVHKKLATEQPLDIESDGSLVQSYAGLKDTDAMLAAAAQAYRTHHSFHQRLLNLSLDLFQRLLQVLCVISPPNRNLSLDERAIPKGV